MSRTETSPAGPPRGDDTAAAPLPALRRLLGRPELGAVVGAVARLRLLL